MMKKANISTTPPVSAFLQISELDIDADADDSDEIVEKDDESNDDDDGIIEEKKVVPKKKIPFVFAQTNAKVLDAPKAPAEKKSNEKLAVELDKSTKEKVQRIDKNEEILFNKPTDKFDTAYLEKIKILRTNTMRQLQKTHNWTPAKREGENDNFNVIKSQQGNKNSDLFVAFLGFLRDTSYKNSPPLFEKVKKKFVK